MSQFQIKCLKKKVADLQRQIADRTRNYLLKYQTKFHSLPSHHPSKTSSSSQSFPHPTSQTELKSDLKENNKQTSNSQHRTEDKEPKGEMMKRGEEWKQMIRNKRFEYEEMGEMLIGVEEEKEGLKLEVMRLSIEIEKFRLKYEAQQKENSEMLQQLQFILKETEKVEKEYKNTKMALTDSQSQIHALKSENYKIFKSYENMRIIEYQLNQTISSLNQKHEIEVHEYMKRNQILQSQLKINKAEKSDLQLAYFHSQTTLSQRCQQVEKLHNQNAVLSLSYKSFISSLCNSIQKISSRLPLVLTETSPFKPSNEAQLQTMMNCIDEFSISYDGCEKKRKLWEKKMEKVMGKLVRLVIKGEGVERLQQMEILAGIEDYMEQIKKSETREQKIGQFISYLMNT